uniref:Adenylate kinase n=1 Tax=Toxoplasma gondii TgCATBr9 TaxID=943120 RepID=A0A2T6IQW4_TOXGO|nr:adenylate kinase [Toxoplasma gondii TgCATBr9]
MRNVAKSLCDACRYKLLPDVETLIRAKMPELSQKKLKAVLDSPERLAAVLAKILEADTELQAAPGCLLVGYPATVAQASAFLKEGAKFEKLVQVSLPMEAVLQRLEEDEDQPDVDREEVERALNAYYVNEVELLEACAFDACAFDARALEACALEACGVDCGNTQQARMDLSKPHKDRAAVGFTVADDARGQAPDEDVFRDLATAEPRDLAARQTPNAEVTALLLAELKRSSTEVLLVCGFPFAVR